MGVLDEKRKLARQEAARSASRRQDESIIPNLDAPNDEAPPAYGEHLDQVQFSQPGIEAGAAVTEDGRVNININTKNKRLRDLLAPTLASQLVDAQPSLPPAYIPSSLGGQPGQAPPPRLNVVIQIVGSRGDVQPFVALGKVLKETYGHRVRIATHGTFQAFVEENDLEFFCIGGDPAELMAFMVKHPGLMPGIDAMKSGEITNRRKGIQQIMLGCWRSCIEAGNGLGPPPKSHPKNEPLDFSGGTPGDGAQDSFVADAIIANPPSFAHIHVAEKLGIPLHMMFTMPWSPTRAFPHPLANIQSSNVDDIMTNYLSYTLVEMMTWQGLGDIINRFREKALDLEPLSMIWAPGLLTRLQIPYTYCWSPALIPKPKDWSKNIDISGFYFLNLASSFTPEPELAAFLEAGPPPVYIGFGSIVVDDPNAMTRMIFDAVHLAGVRALVSKGWGGLGADDVGLPEGVFMLGNVPHDWLFQRVSCVVHHGGAGTTAAGIKSGKPTVVVPFFGDQPFWGAMVAKANAGPDPTPYKALTAEKLAESIKFCLKPETLDRAKELGEKIREEDGTDTGGRSFHRHLDMESLRCALAPSRVAVWHVRKSEVRLSALAATVLVNEGLLQYSDIKLYRSHEYNTDNQPPDPISAGAASLVMDLSGIGMAIADMPKEMFGSKKKKKALQSSSEGESSKQTDSTSDANPNAVSNSDLSTVTSQGVANPNNVATGSTTTLTSADETSSKSQGKRPSNATKATGNAEAQAASAGFDLNVAIDAGRNAGRVVTTGVKSPMNFCLGLAKGFRNVPRLYNDDTVRPVEKVTDLGSGIRIAGKELGYGLFDGISGLVTQPLRGAEKEGASGLFKGFGKGIGGLVSKPAAGFWGVPAYMMQGVHAEVNKFLTRSVQNHIVTARISQGQRDLSTSTKEEKADIIARWNSAKPEMKGFNQMKRAEAKAGEPEPIDPAVSSQKTGWANTRHMTFDERKKLHAQKDALNRESPGGGTGRSDETQSLPEDPEFERAIQASVRETSRGNPEEDAAIEAAIRESVNAARQQGGLPDPVRQVAGSDEKHADDGEDGLDITDEEYQALIEKTIHESVASQSGNAYSQEAAASSSASAADTDLKRAVEASRKPPALPPREISDHDDELQRAIAASKELSDKERGEMNEEEIVMEYVKKQSLAEEQYRQKIRETKGKQAEEELKDDDEGLRRAMEESLKLAKGDSGTGSGPSGS